MAKIKDVLNEEQTRKFDEMKKSARFAKKNNFEHKEKPFRLENGLPYATKFYPTYLVKIGLLIKNNAEFRRMISLAIISLFKKAGTIKEEDKVYINYLWNKFSISINSLKTEYLYGEKLFADAFAVAINLFHDYTVGILNNYVEKEFNEDILDYDTISEITKNLNNIIFINKDENLNGGE